MSNVIHAGHIASIALTMRTMLSMLERGDKVNMAVNLGLCYHVEEFEGDAAAEYFKETVLGGVIFPFEDSRTYLESLDLYTNPKRLEFMRMASDEGKLTEYIKSLHNIA